MYLRFTSLAAGQRIELSDTICYLWLRCGRDWRRAAGLFGKTLDAYLQIAESILRTSRAPMTAREILKRGLALGKVPPRLRGKTQHKTLQARISEDILLRRERSSFFRTKPGVFFLREFITDTSIPEKYRVPIIARRRQRELAVRQALAFDTHTVEHLCASTCSVSVPKILNLLQAQQFHYARSTKEARSEDVLVWAFMLVLRDNAVLTYRHGRYREERDSFLRKRSLGFFSPVVQDDLSLFDQSDHGIVASGLRALNVDLNLNAEYELADSARLDSFVCTCEEKGTRNLLAVVYFDCPEWFEPLTRRLAINDLRWHDLSTPVNHLEDFDPWSQLVLDHAQRTLGKVQPADEASAQEVYQFGGRGLR
ncbi:winged helix-turn-helix domain-containing protein [Bradyrhizobium sp. 174]|uniref:winged helix-turn-helix domain-containing protein n=1 Tax=Bradyrhizobium sp. 174 TaxID=2782645 RepID=UPI001FF7057C|nr:winged helix-turn-helix domain-containing protein [Bradyrhizobium sp. 174]MCK1570335.1 winged helix-turn-helix domain-containing protein [Bradyrhizobium sp. 174]